MKIIFILLVSILFLGCSPKKLFPTDNTKYDSIKNYNYVISEHNFNSKDSTMLYGLHIKSKSKSKGMIVVANGMYKNMSYRFTQWLWIADNGYDVFIFDYRGYGESKDLADIYGMRDDVNAAIEYAHLLNDTNNMLVIGQSMGGSFVIDAMAKKDYDYISLIVADSTFIGFDSILNTYLLKSIIFIPLFWLPYTFVPDDINSIENVNQLKKPILFISGNSDWIVSSRNSKTLYQKANNKKAIWIVESAGHVESFNNVKLRKDFLDLLENKIILENKTFK